MASRVLVVEDEPDIRDLLAFHLEREGYLVTRASTGAEGLRQARATPPDLVILDLMLPEMDGLEVCRRLRADAGTAALPVIMLTAKGDEVDRVVGLEIGADDYIVKPFSPKELLARVRAVLRRSRAPADGDAARGGRHRPRRRHPSGDRRRAAARAHPQGVRSPPRAPRGARARPLARASSWIASGAMRGPTRSSRGRWTCTCAGCGPSWAPRASASSP